MKAHGTVSSRFRDVRVVVGVVVVAVVGTVLVGLLASARNGQALAETGAEASTVSCPRVVDQLPAVPAAAAADVDRELTALENQINEANNRLVSSAGQGGPNFVDNAILGPLRDKRVATLERIEISIGRHADRPTGLVALADCTLNGDGGNGNGGGGEEPASPPAPPASSAPPAPTDPPSTAPAPPPAGTLAVSCPSVVDQLPAVPAAAAADVDRELTALENQINEANNRLVSSVGQGGPNFVDNAILGPLRDKRVATLERIEISIGRHADRPTGLVALAGCSLNQ